MSSGEPFGSSLLFYLNGKRMVIDSPDLDLTLLQYLRNIGLTGTKLGCGEGGCGACTVMVSRYDIDQDRIIHSSVNACLCPLYTVDGKHIITVEGLGSTAKPHPVQERIALLHGSQCGFCTPGFVMSLYTLLRNNPNPTELEIEECFDGNLCRCTGYRPILDAAKTFADQAWKRGAAALNGDGTARVTKSDADGAQGGCGIDGCCRLQKSKKQSLNDSLPAENAEAFTLPDPTNPHVNGVASGGCCGGNAAGGGGCCKTNGVASSCRKDSGIVAEDSNSAEAEKAQIISKFQAYDPTQDLIFPPFLVRYARGKTSGDEPQLKPLEIVNSDASAWCQRFYRPLSLEGLLSVCQKYPGCKLVAGNSEVGVEIKLKRSKFPVQVYVNDIPELRQITIEEDQVTFGANITLARFEHTLEKLMAENAKERTQSFAALRENLRYFAGNQIRNVATIAGNIATASPISDLNPVFMAAGAVVTLASSTGGRRQVPMSEFFLGYRRTAMQSGEVLLSVAVPFNSEGEVVRAFKQAKRKDDDIAIVTCGLRVRVDKDTGKVSDAAFAYGGMAPTTIMAKQAMHAAVGSTWGDRDLLSSLLSECQNEMRLDFAVPGGMAEYRSALTTSFLFKFWATSCRELGIDCAEAAFAHEMEDEERTLSKGKQEYASITDKAIVGKGVTHLSALKQVTGEARYTDDIPAIQGELYMGLVMSQRAHARIVSIDTSKALEMPGVHRVLTAKDVPGSNKWNIFHDEEILPSDEVHYLGQPLALVIADTQKIAQEAARSAVAVEYEDLPAVLGVREAVAKQSFFDEVRQLKNGDVDKALEEADFVFEGESYCGPQEHFYLETMGAISVPKGEGDEFDIYSSTQNPTETQMVCAEVLGVPASRIVCHVKRMGGGFGGKESRSVLIAAFTALASYHTNKSVRIILDRDEDMQTSGQRHPFFGKWKVGVTRQGKLLGLRANIYSNGGFSHDLSIGVLERAVSHLDNCYRIPNTEIVGRVCRTNTQSNTAFRSFGGCQGMFMLESMLCEVADKLGLSVEHLREINMYEVGDVTPFSQKLDDWNVPLMWAQIKDKAQYEQRRREVDEFNAKSRYRKRGLALVPTKFGISFGVKHLNQGMALVHIYMDGSVLVAHGGTEMGQGLHTKMAMIAAETLELPLESIFISETATNTAANTSPTAASASSDLNGFAVYNACKALADRLRPYREKMAGEPFAKIAKAAYLDRCKLTEAGHYGTPDIGFNWQKNEGLLYFYFTQGVAAAEVELDTLTGAHTTRRVDIIMDVGKSLNKAIDIGQIEGAFAQGQGWTTTEEFLYFPSNGRLFTQGPGNYKIPSAMDIPRDFRVSLLEGVPYSTLKTIFSSKGIGEPPLFLGASVFFALRDAVLAARKHSNVQGTLHLESPATAELLRLACEDELVELARIPAELKSGKTPFALRI
ncbi:xanthine dehydrogenase [Martensiomyces pterosporus]|nr:xanthine dehydrogenase [Martensiomyces pterosporus]